MGEATRIAADVEHGAWVVHATGPLDATGVAQLSFTLTRLVRVATADLVVDLRSATGDTPTELLEQTRARAAAAGLGFAVVEPGEPDEQAALIRAGLTSRRRRGRTALTPDQVAPAA